jgi:hypothetical protein
MATIRAYAEARHKLESLPYPRLVVMAARPPCPYLGPLPFSGFVLALRMAYGLARELILIC